MLEEARARVERIMTPTPDPYTPIPSDTEIDDEGGDARMQNVTETMTFIYNSIFRVPRKSSTQ